MDLVRVASAVVLFVAACANARSSNGTDAPPGDSGSNGPNQCKAGEVATDVGPGGVTCAPASPVAQTVIDSRCSIYLGWQDGCDGCTTPPTKWGRVGGSTCVNGAGANDTCTTQNLGGESVTMFGLDTDGDVDGNDKLYWSLHCTTPAPTTVATAPCKSGEFIDGKVGSAWTCSPLAAAVATYIHDHCAVYFGWQDSCDGCTRAPTKWGYAGGTTCMNGAGADDTCSTATLGGEAVTLFGLNTDGDVDGNDKLHIGLRCTTAAQASTTSTTGCPAGQFVVGVSPTGSFDCESLAPLVVQYFSDHCSIELGWRDSCDGCPGPPTKWGRVRVGLCQNGTGADNTCSTFMLGGQSVAMFGLNPDGNVDGNDALYVGFQCR